MKEVWAVLGFWGAFFWPGEGILKTVWKFSAFSVLCDRHCTGTGDWILLSRDGMGEGLERFGKRCKRVRSGHAWMLVYYFLNGRANMHFFNRFNLRVDYNIMVHDFWGF